MTHTPTPWTHDQWVIQSGSTVIADCGVEEDDVPLDEDLANAAFIVRACNAHDELVAERDRYMGWYYKAVAEREAVEARRDELVAALEAIRDDYLALDEMDVRRIANAALAKVTA